MMLDMPKVRTTIDCDTVSSVIDAVYLGTGFQVIDAISLITGFQVVSLVIIIFISP